MTPRRVGTQCPRCRGGQLGDWDRDGVPYCLSCGCRPEHAPATSREEAQRYEVQELMRAGYHKTIRTWAP